jgi:dihydrofolate synthase / folylpolyglutamate synthase
VPEHLDFPIRNADKETLFPSKQSCSIGDPGDTIVITGSIYLLGEVLERLTGQVAETGAALQDLP